MLVDLRLIKKFSWLMVILCYGESAPANDNFSGRNSKKKCLWTTTNFEPFLSRRNSHYNLNPETNWEDYTVYARGCVDEKRGKTKRFGYGLRTTANVVTSFTGLAVRSDRLVSDGELDVVTKRI